MGGREGERAGVAKLIAEAISAPQPKTSLR